MTRSIIASIIIALLTVYSISVVIAYFYNISVTFPFSISNGSYVPEHRLKAMRLSLFLTFIFFSFYYFFYGSKKFYPIQIIALMIFNLTEKDVNLSSIINNEILIKGNDINKIEILFKKIEK